RHGTRSRCGGRRRCGRIRTASSSGWAPSTPRRIFAEPGTRWSRSCPRARSRSRNGAMIGWLLDTNVLAELSSRRGELRAVACAVAQPGETQFMSGPTLAEAHKGIAALPEEDPARARYSAALSALELRFSDRILSVGDEAVRRWGVISG